MSFEELPLNMDNGLSSVFAPSSPTRKAAARAALVDINESSRSLLSECFRQFGIETAIMSSQAADRLHKEKFEACVVNLDQDSGAFMETLRASRSNSRSIIYGVGGSAQEAMKYSRYGINAMFHEPVERPAALKLVRATHLLVLHEFRRYVRIPVMTEVLVVGDGRRFIASSIEMSSGGMSLRCSEDVSVGTNFEVSFALMTLPRVIVRSAVSWKRPKLFGVRFDAADDRRRPVKTWIDSYLEN
jgi:hypothetical protein